jgi:hypothetical protein
MTSESMPVGIVLEKRRSDHPWEDHYWIPVGVAPGAPQIDQWREIGKGDGWVRYHAGTLPLEIYKDETEDYRYNLANDPPSVYVVLRDDDDAEAEPMPFKLTVSPSEAQAYLDAEEHLLEAVEMPELVQHWLTAFVERYHVDQPVYKRKRKPHDPRKGGDGIERPAAPASIRPDQS